MSLAAARMERVLLGVLVRRGAHARLACHPKASSTKMLRTQNLAAVMTGELQHKALMTWGVAVQLVSTGVALTVNRGCCRPWRINLSLQATAQQKETTSWDAGTKSFLKLPQRFQTQHRTQRQFATLNWTHKVCGLPKDRGPERDFVVKWAFDMEYGGCSRFWWGGTVSFLSLVCCWHCGVVQGGNRNNFDTKEECDEICVHPEGKKVLTVFISNLKSH